MLKAIQYRITRNKKLSSTLKEILGFQPGNLELYRLAFLHKSAIQNNGESDKVFNNERLEFLGDALLGAIVTEYLYLSFPFKDEGFLTRVRSKIVSRQHLNFLADKMGLIHFLVKDKSKYEGSSIYGNALEALIGSIYLDKGFKTVKKFIINRLFKLYINVEELINTEFDYKSKLTQWAQKEKKVLEFRILADKKYSESEKYHIGIFVDSALMGECNHSSKKIAEQTAAARVWNHIELELTLLS